MVAAGRGDSATQRTQDPETREQWEPNIIRAGGSERDGVDPCNQTVNSGSERDGRSLLGLYSHLNILGKLQFVTRKPKGEQE